MDTKSLIARELATSQVGLLRAEILVRLKTHNIPDGTIDSQISNMTTAGYIVKSRSGAYYRYSLTAKGRAAFSTINDDDATAQTKEQYWTEQELDVIRDIDAFSTSAVHLNTTDTTAPVTLQFNQNDVLDKALFGLVTLIRDVATQQPDEVTISNKADAIALLESMEASSFINGPHRATFARIRQAVQQLEEPPC
jgi:DNA-binding MarR family transcriptional regulator